MSAQPKRRAVPPPGWRTVAQVAATCGVSEERVYGWLHTKQLEYKDDRTDVSCKQHLVSDDALSRCAPAMRLLLAKINDGPPGEPFEEVYVGGDLYVNQVHIEDLWSAVQCMGQAHLMDTLRMAIERLYQHRGGYAVQRILTHLVNKIGNSGVFDAGVSAHYVEIMEEWKDRMGDMHDWNIALEHGSAHWVRVPFEMWSQDKPRNPFAGE